MKLRIMNFLVIWYAFLGLSHYLRRAIVPHYFADLNLSNTISWHLQKDSSVVE